MVWFQSAKKPPTAVNAATEVSIFRPLLVRCMVPGRVVADGSLGTSRRLTTILGPFGARCSHVLLGALGGFLRMRVRSSFVVRALGDPFLTACSICTGRSCFLFAAFGGFLWMYLPLLAHPVLLRYASCALYPREPQTNPRETASKFMRIILL